jgi:hypothetical protein
VVLQLAQAAPPAPHADCERPAVRQVVPAQQPPGQLAAVQGLVTQAPATQRLLAPHAGPAPQRQAPAVHASEALASQAVQAAPPRPQVPGALG